MSKDLPTDGMPDHATTTSGLFHTFGYDISYEVQGCGAEKVGVLYIAYIHYKTMLVGVVCNGLWD